ncbi:hypothetical protein AVEN_269354-1 [Araneus ventricosus]|uniref:CCHC-type domain-containing protein n=1 Tax=Araneus ventricosus TaxID=182803 RepID=A0A4Y2V7B4_ARAVE|nr:hypothetical protein AVEN_269354-1 [Araneus ventricosus]
MIQLEETTIQRPRPKSDTSEIAYPAQNDTGDVPRRSSEKILRYCYKLSEMEIKIDENLLSIMLLYSLPASYENFRCAIESRDDLPSADVLRIKIIEESEARRHDSGAQSADSGSFTACHHKRKNASWNSKSKSQKEVDNKFKIKCFKCNKWGDHKAAQCKSQKQSTPGRKHENDSLLTSTKWNNNTADALLASNKEKRWWTVDVPNILAATNPYSSPLAKPTSVR